MAQWKKGIGRRMKVRDLIKLLEELEKPDAEVLFKESFPSTAHPGERAECGSEEGSPILDVSFESSFYKEDDGTEYWEDHAVLKGEIMADIPGHHYPPVEDEEGTQSLGKYVPYPEDEMSTFEVLASAARRWK